MSKIYKKPDSNFYILELWDSSTKHPDSVFDMEDFTLPRWVDKNNPIQINGQVFQWLLECASKLNHPSHAYALADYAMREWTGEALEKKLDI